MAINKNFVIKNGVQVGTDLIVGDSDTKKVGIGTTIAGYTLHVAATNAGGRGGIGATDAVITGVGTIKDLLVTGFSGFSSDISVTGVVSARSFGIGTTEIIDRGMRLSGIASLDAITIATIEEAIRVGPNSFTDLKVTGISTFIGIATFSTGIDIKSGVSTFSAPLRLGFAHTTDHAGVALGATVGFGTSAFFRDDAAIFMGSDSDLKIHHDGSNSRIQDVGTGDLIIQGSADIKLQSASAENYIVANDTGSVDVYFDNSKKLETTSGGLKVTGITTLTDRLHVEAGISTFDADVRFGIGATVGFGTSAFFKDEASIFMGDADDFELFHDGTDSVIRNRTGDLKLLVNNTENGIVIKDNEGVEVYYDNSKKLESTSGGLNVTGITTFSDRINVVSGVSTFQDDAKLTFGAQTDLLIQHDGTDTEIYNKTGNLKIRSNDLDIQDYANGHSMITADRDGSVDLFYDNYNALQTTPQGINVSGVTTSNRLNISGVSTFTSVGSNLIPDVDGSRNIGAATSEWGDLFVDGTAHVDVLDVDETAFVTTKLTVGTGVTVQSHGVVAIAGITTVGGNLLAGGDILPDDDGARDLGSSSKEFEDLHIDGTAHIDVLDVDETAFITTKLSVGTGVTAFANGNLAVAGIATITDRLHVQSGISTFDDTTQSTSATTGAVVIDGGLGVAKNVNIGGNLTVTGTTTLNGGTVTLGDANTDNVVFSADVDSSITPDDDDTYDLGSTSKEWRDLHIDGIAHLDNVEAGIGTFSSNLLVSGISTFGDDITFQTANGNNIVFDKSDNDVTFGDSVKLRFGASNDLSIEHDESNSYISDSGTGALFITGSEVSLKSADTSELMLKATENDSVELYHNNVKAVETTADGILVGTGVTIQKNGGVSIAGITTIGNTITVSPGGNDRISVTADTVNLSVEDNTTDAFTLKQASNEYITLDTNNTTELLTLGNSTTNPNTLILGGKTTVGTGVTIQGHGGVSAAGIVTAQGLVIDSGTTNTCATFKSTDSGAVINLTDNSTRSSIEQNGTDLKIISDTDDADASSTIKFQVDAGTKATINSSGDFIVGTGVTIQGNGVAAFAGIVTAGGGFNIGIQSAGIVVAQNVGINTLNFLGAGNSITYHAASNTLGIDIAGSGGGGGVSETETSVSTTSATSCGSFVKTAKRSAAVLAQITQGSNYQVGRYLLIHDGTTVTTIEESAIATGSMLGTFEGVINGSNVEFRVTMSSSSSATVTTKIDSISIPS